MKLDPFGNAAPSLDTEDFTIVNNYLLDFWGAIMGDSAVSTFLHLKRYAHGKRDFCTIDIDMIALKMGTSKNPVKGYLSILEEHGFITTSLRTDAEDASKDASPLFKIRKYVPLITKEMYDDLHPKLQGLHDEFVAEFDHIKLNLKPSDADESIKEIAANSDTVNNKEIKEKMEKVVKGDQPIERILNSLSNQEVMANELIRNAIEEKVSRPTFETWMKSALFIVRNDKKIDVIAPNSFASDWISTHYSDLIKEIAVQFLSFNNAAGTVDVMSAEKYEKANMSRGDV